MSLINHHSEQAAPSLLDIIKSLNTGCLNTMGATAARLFDIVWHTKGKSPQEVCDLLGTEAVKAFELHAKMQELIYALDPTWVPLVPPHEYVKNADGTVTIGAKVTP